MPGGGTAGRGMVSGDVVVVVFGRCYILGMKLEILFRSARL